MARTCASCGASIESLRPQARFCGPTCRKTAGKARGKGIPERRAAAIVPLHPEQPEPEPTGAVHSATRAALMATERDGTPLGQAALVLAARMDAAQDTGSALAALAKQLQATLEEATRGANLVASPLDELRARRAARRA